MALYRKFVRRGMITNKLIYREYEFVERWKKDVVLMCEGDTISKQVNNTFDNLSVKELEIIENLGFYTDFDLEEKKSELSDHEALYDTEGGSSKEKR